MTTPSTIQLEWDIGTAYDMFASLMVLHEPETVGLRGSWAAGVRSRLPTAEREFLQKTQGMIWSTRWVYTLPEPKDGATVLRELQDIPPALRIPSLVYWDEEPQIKEAIANVAEKGAWNEADLSSLISLMVHDAPVKVKMKAAKVQKHAVTMLDLAADYAGAGELLLSSLTRYYDQFFAEEELRILPVLEDALEQAQQLAKTLVITELLEELSQGLRLEEQLEKEFLVLAPSYWITPLIFFGSYDENKAIYLFGARPPEMSLIPGDVVPDALHQALKALANPTRLRILRYLSDAPATPSELAKHLRLRSPTVIHHLDVLRIGRLVQLTLERDGRRYVIRPEAVEEVCNLLNLFLDTDSS